MDIRRHCYDKPRRCPGWAGGGWKHPKPDKDICPGALLNINWDSKWWKWQFHKCETCGVIALPVHVQKLDWTYWRWEIWYKSRRLQDRWWDFKWKYLDK